MSKSSLEWWASIFRQIDRVRAEQGELLRRLQGIPRDGLPTDNGVPKSVWDGDYKKMHSNHGDPLSDLRFTLEDRMFEEHPERADISITSRGRKRTSDGEEL